MPPSVRRLGAATVATALAAVALTAPVTSAAPATSTGQVEVTYSGYNDATTTHRLSQQPAKTLQPVGDGAEPAITVDPSVAYQTWEGFGGSLEDTTVYNLNRLSPSNRDAALTDLFDPVTGNGFSLMRLPIGCADFCRDQPDYWTYADNDGAPDPGLSTFSVQRDVDNGLIDMLHDIMEINPGVKFYSSMWSPPAWMKTNGSIIGPDEYAACHREDAPRVHHGASTGSAVDYYPVLADYYVRYLKAYQELGVPIYAVTLQNEPDISMPYPTTCFSPAQLADFAVELGDAFDEAGLTTKIWGLDANEADTFHYADPLLGDPAVAQHVDGLGWHNYGGTAVWQPTAVEGMHPGVTAHVTEISNGATRLIEYFRNQVASYSYWVTMYEFDPGPGPSFWSDKPRDPETDPDFYTPSVVSFADGGYDDYQLNGWYYSFGQFSRYVQTGAQRIDSSGTVAGTVSNVAFRNPDGTIVVVAANRGSSRFNSDLTDAGPATFRIVTPSGEFTDTLPGDTVATYVITPTTGDPVAATAAEASESRPGYGPEQAVDGDTRSLWTSGTDQATGDSLTIDLGDTRRVDRLALNHGTLGDDHPRAFEVQASVDGTGWSTAVPSAVGTSGLTTVGFDAVEARYLRVVLTDDAARWWSVAEATAYDSSTGLLPLESVTASAFADAGGADVPAAAVDGNARTRWSSGTAQAPGQTFTLDLGTSRAVSALELDTGPNPGDHPRRWELRASTDGSDWTPVLASGTGEPATTRIDVDPVTARYLQVTQTGAATNSWWSIAEARVTGPGASTALDRDDWSLTASSGATSLDAMVDGDPSTRWTTGTAQAAGQELTVDMAERVPTTGVVLDATGSTPDRPRSFAIDVSLDGATWRTVAEREGHTASVPVSWPATEARFVRVRLTGSSAQWWSVHELDVHTVAPSAGPGAPLDRSGWSAEASSTGSGQAGDVLDGLQETRWTSAGAQDGADWFQVDLGTTESFSAIQLNAAGPPDWTDQVDRTYRGDFAREYEVYVSNGDGWELVASGVGRSSADVIRFPEQTARYLNVQATGSSAHAWGVAELLVYE